MIHNIFTELDLARPLWEHAGHFPPGDCAFLLDSALEDEKIGRHTYLGGNPAAVLTGYRVREEEKWPEGWCRRPTCGVPFRLKLTTWMNADGTLPEMPLQKEWVGDPFQALRELQQEYSGQGRDLPPASRFTGGLVGYFGYEVAHAIENLPDTGEADADLPDLAFMVADAVVCEDRQTGKVTLAVTGRGEDAGAAVRQAREMAGYWQALIQDSTLDQPSPLESPGKLTGDFDRPRYGSAVEDCRQHILAGDVFEVCLTHRLETGEVASPWSLYRELRRINPAPFASWLQFPLFQVISASPERFLSLGPDWVAESRPIKGTRPRGKTPEEDAKLAWALAESEKDRAENLMIVDLVRNDLGKVAQIGSVQVPELLKVETYATVFQLVSTIQAKLRDDCDALDLVRACYPGGSMTGAPKIEAMKIIDSLETRQRGVFSGAIGYLDRSGIMDLSIVIRTIVCQAGRTHFGVGGAVTADSDPDAEYQETLDKARALAQALGCDL